MSQLEYLGDGFGLRVSVTRCQVSGVEGIGSFFHMIIPGPPLKGWLVDTELFTAIRGYKWTPLGAVEVQGVP